MRALVTGSTGFIGAKVCTCLLEKGYRVRAFHRPSSSLRLLDGMDVEHALGDLGRPETLEGAMEGVDVVFHCAAMLGGGREGAGRLYTITVEGTRAIMQAALRKGVQRVVHTSSAAALGVPDIPPENGTASVMDETHTWNYPFQKWPYGYAKYLAELEVQKAVASGLDAVIVNPTLVFGAGDIYRQTSSLVVQVASQRLPVVVEGGVNVVHIRDVVRGHLATLEKGKRGERYILGGENLTLARLAELIAETAAVPPPGVILPAWLVHLGGTPAGWLDRFISMPFSGEILNLAGRYFYYSSANAQKDLGIADLMPAADAVREAYEWFLQVGAIIPKQQTVNG